MTRKKKKPAKNKAVLIKAGMELIMVPSLQLTAAGGSHTEGTLLTEGVFLQ